MVTAVFCFGRLSISDGSRGTLFFVFRLVRYEGFGPMLDIIVKQIQECSRKRMPCCFGCDARISATANSSKSCSNCRLSQMFYREFCAGNTSYQRKCAPPVQGGLPPDLNLNNNLVHVYYGTYQRLAFQGSWLSIYLSLALQRVASNGNPFTTRVRIQGYLDTCHTPIAAKTKAIRAKWMA